MAKRAPAKAIDNVADPAPALAFTTSVPASCGKMDDNDLQYKFVFKGGYLNTFSERFKLVSWE